MKNTSIRQITSVALVAICLLMSFRVAAQCSSCTSVYNGTNPQSNQTFNVTNGQIYCIQSGANIQNCTFNVNNGGTLCISGGTFGSNNTVTIRNGGTMSVSGGTISNSSITVNANGTFYYGTAVSNVTFNTGANVGVLSGVNMSISGGTFNDVINSGTLSFSASYTGTFTNNGTASISSDLKAAFVNNTGASFTFTGNIGASSASLDNYGTVSIGSGVNYNSGATFKNEQTGYMTFQGNSNMNQSGILLTNLGHITVNGDLSTAGSNDVIVNRGYLAVMGNFNPLDSLGNYGMVNCYNFFNGNGSRIYNYCRLLAYNGSNPNSGHFYNNGLFWITNTGSGAMQINGSTMTGGTGATFRMYKFINSSTVDGYGNYYFTGPTTNQGPFNGSSSVTPIQVYDATPPAGTQVFDAQNTNPTNTIRVATMTIPDTINSWNNCTDANFRTIAVQPNITTLPVQLQEFTGRWNANKLALLDWKSQSEENLQQYNLEKSIDGITFITINTTKAKGQAAEYSWVDPSTDAGVRYYRLGMIDNNGSISYSPVVRLAASGTGSLNSLTASPIPFTAHLDIRFSSATEGTATVLLTDAMGKIVRNQSILVHEADNTFSFTNTDVLPTGIYFLHVTTGDAHISVKVVKQ